jgi:hypothetical protein
VGSLDDLVRDLKAFDDRRELTKALGKQIRKPVPLVRKAIRDRALATLPKGGGLNVWVSKTRVQASIKLTDRKAYVKLRGSRKSTKDASDLKRMDAGTTRHPSWGRRGAGQWHAESVTPGFFTEPTTQHDQWRSAVLDAVDEALKTIKRG